GVHPPFEGRSRAQKSQLDRAADAERRKSAAAAPHPVSVPTARSALALFVEKLPLFGLAGAVSILTLIAEGSDSAFMSLRTISVRSRLANAAAAYGWYVEKTFWPSNLTVYYPHAHNDWTWPPVLAGIAILLAGSAAAWAAR